MSKDNQADARDIVRQVAVVCGALFQVLAVPAGTLLLGTDIARISEQNATLVTPADYAFVIWNPIFLLALAYAAYQALPSRRADPLLRKIGPFAALAFFSNGLWELLFPAREFVPAQVVFLGIFAGAGVAYLYVQRVQDTDTRAKRWLLAPAFGLFFGWVTAAIFVGLATTLVALGVLGGTGEALFGAALVLVCGVLASFAVLLGGRGPILGYTSYATAVVWAFGGIAAAQYKASILTTGAAVLAGLVVALLLSRILLEQRSGGKKTHSIARSRVD